MQYTPTILIGLGGLGSTIVNDIYAKLHPDMHQQTVVLAMDTDVNWIRSLKNLPENNIIQTSQNQTVEQYIYNKERSGDSSIQNWFQMDIPELQRKLMTDGAGQVRTISRLALRGAIENNEIQKIIAEINRINIQSSSRFVTGVRVCIVGSLAGGTGSGIFLQIALMIKKILRERFGVETVMTIGYFLLAGILQGCGKITGQNEVDNIYANTYACFKELNALTVNASAQKSKYLNIQFEYDPMSNDTLLSKKDLPFDYYHIIDHLNLNGKNLGRFENYLTMMVNNIYVYLFSPIASGAFSKLDNQILSLISSGGQKRVCGSAAGRLVYPYEDILRLFSIKRTVNSINELWTKFEHLFETDMNEYKQRRNQGDTKVERPSLQKKYIFYLEAEIKKDKADPNFVLIGNQLNLFDENREIIGRKSIEWLREIEMEISHRIETDKKLQELQNDRKTPKLIDLKEANRVKGKIENAEKLLFELENATRDFVDNNKILARKIFFDDEKKNLRGQTIYNGEKYYLNYWMLGEEPLHPIATRVFIYEAINSLEVQVAQLNQERKELQEDYEGIKNKYNNQKGKDGKGTPQSALRTVLDQPFYKRFLPGQKGLPFFSEGYMSYFRKRKAKLIDLAKKDLQIRIYETLLTQLRLKASIIEGFFFSLNYLLDKYDLEERELSIKYAEEIGYDRNVLARPEILEKLWRSHENRLVSFDELPEDLSRTIYCTFYDNFCEKVNNEHLNIEYSSDFLQQISEQILKNNKNYIIKEKVLDLDIISAIREEARLMGKSEIAINKYLAEKLQELHHLVEAFGPDGNLIDRGKSSFYSMWGLNENVNKFISSQLKQELEMEDKTDASFIADERFDKREIIRAKILMGQSLDLFLKFYYGDDKKAAGAYYTSYQKRIAQLQNPNADMVTPHLDRRWHLPHYLPEIFPALNEKTQQQAVDTLLKGMMTHTIAIKKVGGIAVWTANHQVLSNSEGEQMNRLNINSLLAILFQNPQLQSLVEQEYKNQLQKDHLANKKEYANYNLVYQAKHIYYPVLNDQPGIMLDALLNFFETEEYQSKDRVQGMLLLRRFRKLLEEIIKLSNPNDHFSIQEQKYTAFIQQEFIDNSSVYQQLPVDDILTGEIKKILLG